MEAFFGLEYGNYLVTMSPTPLWVPMFFSVLFYSCMTLSRKLTTNVLVIASTDAVLVFFLVFSIEPIAVNCGFWKWAIETEYRRVPLTSFVTWVIFCGFYSLFLQLLKTVQGKIRCCSGDSMQIPVNIFQPFCAALISIVVIFICWIGYAWVCGIESVIYFVPTFKYSHETDYVYIVQAFFLCFMVGFLLVFVIFFSRTFATNTTPSLPNIALAFIPLSYQFFFLAALLIDTTFPISTMPELLITHVCCIVLTFFFHLLPFLEHLRSLLYWGKDDDDYQGPVTVAREALSYEGVETEDEVEKLLNTPSSLESLLRT